MAADNLDRLRSLLEQLFEERRIRPELLDDDAEWVNPHDAVEPGTRRGAAAFNDAIASVFATWDHVHFEPERLIDNGDDLVALGVLHGRVHGPGIAVEAPHGQIWTFREGRVVGMQWFNTHQETLKAAGLSSDV